MVKSSGFKNSVLLVAAFAHFHAVLITQAVSQTIASTALPTGGTVRAGAATLTQGGTAGNPSLTINQTTNRAAIDWSTFNIGSASAVQFVQPDATSSTLNRVLDTNASQIFGRLTSNGQVFLMNPNGVIFGASASVDVGGLVATTHALSNEDYMAGKTTFTRNGATGKIINEGTLTSRLGGYIALLAPEVRNNGVIIARAGTVALAAGDTIALNFSPDASLTQVLASPSTVQALIDNKKIVAAPDGQVIVSAQAYNELTEAAINNSGTINAGSIKKSGGKIFLDTSGTLTNSGTIKANSKQADGGTVTLKGKLVSNTGTVSANGGTAGVTNGVVTDPTITGKGGTIHMLGDQVGLFGNSFVSASGMTGGGTVLIGGDWQGGNGVPQSRQVLMGSDAKIDASALYHGHGGKVVLWSTDWTGFYGSIKATGGSQGGDGGKVETSSHKTLQAMGRLDLTAPKGKGGQWLVDPEDVFIVEDASNVSSNYQNNSGSFDAVDTRQPSTITDRLINSELDADVSVTINATRDLYVQGGVVLQQGTGNASIETLTLIAANTLYIDKNATLGFGKTMNFTFQAQTISGAAPIGVLGPGGGTVTFDLTSGGTYSGLISDGLDVVVKGGGTLNLTADNTYSGGTSIRGNSTLIAGAGGAGPTGAVGTGTVDIAAGSVFKVARSADITLSQDITGAGNLQIGDGTSTGKVTLAGAANTYTGDTTIASGATLQIGDNGTTGSTSSANIMNSGALAFKRTDALTIASVISGAGAISQTGSGTTTLSGNNTATDVYNITAGTLILSGSNATTATATISSGATLQIGDGGTTGSLASTSIANAGTLSFNRTDTGLSVSSVISGVGVVSQTGTGTVTLTGANTYTGNTNVTGTGTLKIGTGGSLASGTKVNLQSSGATWDLNNTGQLVGGLLGVAGSNVLLGSAGGNILNIANATDMTFAGVISGAGGLIKGAGSLGVLTLSGLNTFTGTTQINGGTLAMGAVDALATTSRIGIGPSGTFDLANFNQTIKNMGSTGTVRLRTATLTLTPSSSTTFDGVIRDTGNVVLNASTASVVFQLNGVNTFSGTLTVTRGNLVLTAANASVTSATIGANGTLRFGDNNAAKAGSLGTNATIANSGLVDFYRFNPNTAAYAISGSGNLRQRGTGAVTLTGNNSYTGTTTVATGSSISLIVGSSTAIPSASELVVQIGGSIDLGGYNVTAASLGGDGGTVILGSNTLTLTTVTGQSNHFPGAITSSTGGSLVIGNGSATGTQRLSGTSTYNGSTTIVAGATLQIGSGGTTGSIASPTITVDGILAFDRTDNMTFSAAISGTGAVKQIGTGTTTLSGNNTISGDYAVDFGRLILTGTNDNVGTIVIGTDAELQIGNGGATGTLGGTVMRNFGSLVFNRSGALAVPYDITDTGRVSQIGSGTTTLSGYNDFTGPVLISNGTLVMGTALALTGLNALTMTGGTLDLGGFDLTVGSLAGTGGTVDLGGFTLVAGDDNTSTTFAGTLIGTGGSLSKNGSGTMTLSGNNSLTGSIAVFNDGTLKLTGSNDNATFASTLQTATLQIGDGGTTGSLATASFVNNATLKFNRSDAMALSGDIGGFGDVKQVGTGTTTLSGNNTSSGSYQVNAGQLILTGANSSVASATVDAGATLQLGAGGSWGNGNIVNNGSFLINTSANTSLSANVTGTGSMSSTVTGSLTLNGTITQASLDLSATDAITVAGAVSTSGNVGIASTTGAVVLDAGIDSSAGNIVIRAPQFTNHVGASALTASGTGQYWQVWSTNSDPFNANAAIGDTANGLVFDYKHYNATYGVTSILGTGNGLYYSYAPTVTASLTGTVIKPYDGNNSATLTLANVSISGLGGGDVVSNSLSGATYAGSNAGSSILVSWPSSGMVAQSSAATGNKPVYGYSFTGGTVSAAIGTINKVSAVVTADSSTVTYNGQMRTVTGFSATGLVNSESASVLTGVTVSGSGQNAGTYTTTASGTDGNYNLSFVNGTLLINKANATVTAHSSTVSYNGQTQSVSTFSATGLVNSESASVLTGVTVSGSGQNAGTYTTTASGTDGNYNLSFVNGTLQINKVNATVTANSASLAYNGQIQTVTGFSASGLVNNETASMLSGVTASGSGQAVGTYVTSASGTATNYNLTFVNGVLTITPAGSIPNASNPDYDPFILDALKRMKKSPPIDELILSIVCEVNSVAPGGLSRKRC